MPHRSLTGQRREQFCDCLLVFAALCAVWALTVWITDGISWTVGPLEITSRHPSRPVVLSLAAVITFTALGGWRDMAGTRARVRARTAAGALAGAILVLGLAGGTGVAGGADAYGYLSEAELWRAGSLKVEQPWVRELPWPNRTWTATPLGYRPANRRDDGEIVPVYSPGLPFLMAGAKSLAGQQAMFWIVPLFGALLVVATYGIGARLAAPSVGLAAAFLVATSPAVLFMIMWPMTDVAVAACWAMATWAVLGESRERALTGGLAAALAIVVRPNLVWVGILIGLWLVMRDLAARPRRIDRAALFALGALPAVAAVIAFNNALYGSPFVSGYGRFSDFLRLNRFGANVRRYAWSLAWSQTPLAFAGLAAVALPVRWMWRDRERARDAWLLTLVTAGTIGCYLFYLTFDEWWYLRFLLPAWPALFIGVAWLVFLAAGRRVTWRAIAIIVALGAYGAWFANARGVRGLAEQEQRYVIAADLVKRMTPPNSVIFAMQHSGSIRYYGERMTLRYDILPPGQLDAAVTWLNGHGAHPYFLLESWEVPKFQARFGSEGARGRLAVGTVFELQRPGQIFLFDPMQPESTAWPRLGAATAGLPDQAASPGAPPFLRFFEQ